MFTIGLLLALVGVLCVLWALKRQDDLDELLEDLNKWEVHLNGRANKLAADEQTLTQEWKELGQKKNERMQYASYDAQDYPKDIGNGIFEIAPSLYCGIDALKKIEENIKKYLNDERFTEPTDDSEH